METEKMQKISKFIFKEVFGVKSPYKLPELKKKFAIDIPTVNKATCALSKKETWTANSTSDKIASQQAIADGFKSDEWMKKRKAIRSIEDIFSGWNEINYITGEKYINSKDVLQSDSVYNSNCVFNCMSIFDSKNIIFSYKIFDSNYMLASRDCSSCTLGIRMKESIFCSSGFEISWSNKVSKSMYVHDGFDLFECMFCSHIRSKKYCIANMQFEREEYFRLKEMVVNWILSD